MHLDVDWHLAGAAAVKRDLTALKSFCAAQQVTFGVILNGGNSETDPQYATDLYVMTGLMVDTFGSWGAMPDHIIVQSWAVTTTGLAITPSNLPEDRLYARAIGRYD